MKIAFAGLRHNHIFTLYSLAKSTDGVEVAGAWEEDAASALNARQTITEPFYSSYDELLCDPTVDIVAVGDYYGVRGSRICRALEAGKHVLTDKPVCIRAGELERISGLCASTGLKLGCMLDLRYDPALRLAAQRIRGGQLGEVRSMCFTGQHPLKYGVRPGWYFESGKHGGTINDIAMHGIDAVRMITGLEYDRTLCARQWNAFAKHEPLFLDSAQFMGEWSNGAGMIADVSYSAPSPCAFALPGYWRFAFWGDDGFIECRLGEGAITIALSGDEQPQRIDAPAVEENCLTDLIGQIRGTRADGTADVLSSARTVLNIQAATDAATADRKG